MIKEWVEKQGPALWWKATIAVFIAGSLYANIASGLSDHDQRTKDIGGAVAEQKKSLEQLAQESKSMKEIMQQMLRVAKGTCMNTAKDNASRMTCTGD